MKVNNNIEAQRANFNLNAVQKRLTASTNRLSSGYRIVKAADDAAGMAISQGWVDLVGPAMLVGTFGYVIGNYLGTIVAVSLGL